jgi:hypothetical protein
MRPSRELPARANLRSFLVGSIIGGLIAAVPLAVLTDGGPSSRLLASALVFVGMLASEAIWFVADRDEPQTLLRRRPVLSALLLTPLVISYVVALNVSP